MLNDLQTGGIENEIWIVSEGLYLCRDKTVCLFYIREGGMSICITVQKKGKRPRYMEED